MPVSHDAQPGRLTTTSIETWRPAVIWPWGQSSWPLRLIWTGRLCGPVTTLTLSIVPPPSGSPTFASAVESADRVALETTSATAAPAASSSTARTPAATA